MEFRSCPKCGYIMIWCYAGGFWYMQGWQCLKCFHFYREPEAKTRTIDRSDTKKFETIDWS
jgi:hypothetical protein